MTEYDLDFRPKHPTPEETMFPKGDYDPKLRAHTGQSPGVALMSKLMGVTPPDLESDRSAPPWTSGTWLSKEAIYNQGGDREDIWDSAVAAHKRGDLADGDLEYIKSAVYPEGQRSRFTRIMGYEEDAGWMRDVFSVVETLSGYRFFKSVTSAATKGILGQDDDDGIFGVKFGFSTEEFAKEWSSRNYYKDVISGYGVDIGWKTGLALDIVMDPITWLTFGLGAASKVSIQAGGKASAVLAKNINHTARASKISGGASLTLTPYGNDIIKLATDDYINRVIPQMYDMFGVPKGQLMPEHVLRFMNKSDTAADDIVDLAVTNFEDYALRHFNGMRGVGERGVEHAGKYAFRHSIGSLRTVSSRASMSNGPRSMFMETATFMNKPRGFYGDHILGSLAQAQKGVAQKLDGFGAEMATRANSPDSLVWATQIGSSVAEKTYSATTSVRNFFTAAVERLPLDQRARVSAFKTASDHEMANTAAMIRDKLTTGVSKIDPITGKEYTYKLNKADRQLISKHMDNPEVHDLPEHLFQFKSWVDDQFKQINKFEEAWGVNGNTLDHYISHLYSSKAGEKLNKAVRAHAARAGGQLDSSLDPKYIMNRNNFALNRTIATLDDAEKWLGKGMVETDVANILFRRWQVARNVVSKQQIQNFMITEAGIGGLADSFIFQGRSFRQMLRGMNYKNSYLSLGDSGKARDAVKQEIFGLVEDASKLDLRLLAKQGQEAADGALKKTVGHKRKIPEGSTEYTMGSSNIRREVVREDGKWKQISIDDTTHKRIESKTIPWFDSIGDTKALSKKKLQNTIKSNRDKLNEISRKVFDGKSVADLTQAEAEMLRDMLTTVIGTRTVRKGQKFVPPSFGGQNLVVANFINDGVSAVVQPVRYFAKETDALPLGPYSQGRLIPLGTEVMNIADKDINRVARDLLKRRGVKPAGVGARATQYSDEQVVNVVNELRHGSDIPANRNIAEAEAYLKRLGVKPTDGEKYGSDQIFSAIENLITPSVKKVSADSSSIFKLEMAAARGIIKDSDAEIKFLRGQRDKLRESIDVAGGGKKYEQVWNKMGKTIDDYEKALAKLRNELKLKAKAVAAGKKVAVKRIDKAALRVNDLRAKIDPLAEQLDDLFRKQGLDTMGDQLKNMRARKTAAKTFGSRAKARRMRVGNDMAGQYVLPEDMVRALEELTGHAFAEIPAGKLLKGWQEYQRYWKIGLTLPFSEHHFRNGLTNVGLTATVLGVRMLNPTNWKPAFLVIGKQVAQAHRGSLPTLSKIMPEGARKATADNFEKISKSWGNQKVTDRLGRTYTVDQISEEAVKRGLNHAFVHAELGYTPFPMFDSAHHGILTPSSKAARATHQATVGASAASELVVDVPFRITMFTDQILQGKSFDEAAEVVKTYLNDWGRLSKGEKTVARTLIPFYSWTQFSLERAFKDMFLHPDKFVFPNKVFQNLSADEPSIGGPSWIKEKLGISEEPNEHGYIKKLTGFGVNQEEAIKQWGAMKDLATHFLGDTIGMKGAAEWLSPETGGVVTPEQAPYRFLAQSDFIIKAAMELATGRELFSGAAISGDVSLLGKSRLESGYAFSRLDDPSGALENVLTIGGHGGKWLKTFLEYKEDPADPKSAVVNAKKRWFLGQLPTARILSTYEKHVRNYAPGEVNYRKSALAMMGMHAYWYHPGERKYYLDRSRIKYAQRLLRQAHVIDTGVFWSDPVLKETTNIDSIVNQMKKDMGYIKSSKGPKTERLYGQKEKED